MKQPSIRHPREELERVHVGESKHVVVCWYDHESDNYEICVNGESVWGSDGFNDHDRAESTFEAIAETLRVVSPRLAEVG